VCPGPDHPLPLPPPSPIPLPPPAAIYTRLSERPSISLSPYLSSSSLFFPFTYSPPLLSSRSFTSNLSSLRFSHSIKLIQFFHSFPVRLNEVKVVLYAIGLGNQRSFSNIPYTYRLRNPVGRLRLTFPCFFGTATKRSITQRLCHLT
jgi:hypothetical protein